MIIEHYGKDANGNTVLIRSESRADLPVSAKEGVALESLVTSSGTIASLSDVRSKFIGPLLNLLKEKL